MDMPARKGNQGSVVRQKLKLFSFYDGSFEKLKDRFIGTIKDDYEVTIAKSEFGGDKSWAGGLEVWLYKTQYIIDAIRDNLGDIVIVSDIDIQFFQPTEQLVIKCMKGHDIVFQQNPLPWGRIQPVCIGFMGIRCNNATLRFFEEALAEIKKTKRHDQQVIYELLDRAEKNPGTTALGTPIRWGFLPKCFWAYSPAAKWQLMRPMNMVLHHATGTSKEKEKLAQMDEIAERARRPVSSKAMEATVILAELGRRFVTKFTR